MSLSSLSSTDSSYQSAAPPFSLGPPYQSIYGAERGLALPITYQRNVTLERALGRSNAVSVGYVAAAGRSMLRQEYWVKPNDNVTYAYLLRNDAFSNFHSLQAQFQRRLSRGLQALVSFDLNLLRDRLSAKTKMLILNSPHNPTGGVIPGRRHPGHRRYGAGSRSDRAG